LSDQSRKRFLLKLVGVDLKKTPSSLITLTYHHGAGLDPQRWHADLRAFQARLFREWAAFEPSVIWSKEFQRRGAVHYHLLVFWKRRPILAQVRHWTAHAWNEIAEPGDEQHAHAGTSADHVKLEEKASAQKLLRYLAKYLTKGEQKELRDEATGELMPTGRMWGVWGKVPYVELATLELDEVSLAQFQRRVRRWGKHSAYLRQVGRRFQGALIFAEGPAILQLLRGLDGADTPRGPPS